MEEEQLLRASLRTAHATFGTWKALAAAMHLRTSTLEKVLRGNGRHVTAEVAVRLARALGVPLDALTRPGLRPVKAPCPTCGGAA